EPQLRAVDDGHLTMRAPEVIRCELEAVGTIAGAERVDPRVQLEPARVRLLDGECERIVAGIDALCPREHRAPGLDGRCVDGVTSGTNVKDHRVEARRRSAIENVGQLRALLVRRQAASAWPVYVADGGDPQPAHLAHDRGRRGVGLRWSRPRDATT